MAAGMLMQIYVLPHYLAPFTAAFYAIGLQAMRHLRVWSPEKKPVGRMLVRLTVMLCIALGGLRLFAAPLNLMPREWPPNEWIWSWYGPGVYGSERAQVEANLEQHPGGQLAIVRYSPRHYSFNEWVYNQPDIDDSKVVWASEMSAADNLELINYYRGRTVWLVQADNQPATVSPYPLQGELIAASH
jgi:hypothetical protein